MLKSPILLRKLYCELPLPRFLGTYAALLLLRISRVDFLDVCLRLDGIGNTRNNDVSGENYLIRSWLPAAFLRARIDHPTIFDVGANVGDYSSALIASLPAAFVHAFEPSEATFKQLQANLGASEHVRLVQAGLGSKDGKMELWSSRADGASVHASLYKEVLSSQHGYNDLTPATIQIRTIDSICQEQRIPHLHFLKIDTEGHELDVVRGARAMLEARSIDVIQFEFNEMSLASHAFIKDFAEILPGYKFHRLFPDGPHPLPKIDWRCEIHRFQNILAVRDGFL